MTVPASVTVAAASATAIFTATTGTIASNQTATITATLNGSTQTATIALATATVVSGLTCTPASLGSGGSATCTVTVSKTGGATVTLSDNAAALTVPASVTVAAASTTATFTATAGTIASNQTATITATLNGSTQTATISLATLVTLSGMSCNPSSLGPGGSSTCTVTVTSTGGATMTLLSISTALTVPATVTVAPSSTTATFTATAGTVASTQTAIIAAILNGGRQTTTIILNPTNVAAAAALPSHSCSPDSNGAGTLLCTVELAGAAPLNGATALLQSSSARVQVPNSLAIPAGSQSATFAARVAASDQDEQPQISASVEGVVLIASPLIVGIRPTALTCPTREIQAGNWLDCEVRLNPSNIPATVRLVLSSGNADLKIPDAIVTRPGQTRLTFRVYADSQAAQRSSDITVQFGETAVSEAIRVTPASAPVLNIPESVETVFGKPVSFAVSATDPSGLPVVLSASDLPEGAVFDPGTGAFSWTPAQSQQGVWRPAFTATGSATASGTGRVAITVDAGKPVITGIQNAASGAEPACSPGSVASLAGRWLASADTPVADASGAVTELGGARVKVNGEYVPVVYASAARVDFVCPGSAPGTPLVVSAEGNAGIADAVSTTMHRTAPGLYSVDGSGTGQGLITLAGTTLLAASRDYRALGQPAEPGDRIVIRATGIPALDGAAVVTIGGIHAQVESVQAEPGVAGVYEITAEVPLGIQEGDAIPVVVSVPSDQPLMRRAAPAARDIHRFGLPSNPITIAVERPRP
ncbi:MAG: putative Ig domain-containing protein [Acidobacteriia bacterium]|nr:putative Ig domain-containing protein [Terriglobia bacterium]